MNSQAHWNAVYGSVKAEEVSWYRHHLETSLALIEHSSATKAALILDVGGGESTLVDDLLQHGFQNISILDISSTALDVAMNRLGQAAKIVNWIVADITQVTLPGQHYDVWHDRAVFHFLTSEEQRVAYVEQVMRTMKPGGYVIIATFGLEGPSQCSGIDVVRYDSNTLLAQFGSHFRLLDTVLELHQTPSGSAQPFLYCYLQLK